MINTVMLQHLHSQVFEVDKNILENKITPPYYTDQDIVKAVQIAFHFLAIKSTHRVFDDDIETDGNLGIQIRDLLYEHTGIKITDYKPDFFKPKSNE